MNILKSYDFFESFEIFWKFWNFIWKFWKNLEFCKILKFMKILTFFCYLIGRLELNLVSGWTTLKHRIDNRQK